MIKASGRYICGSESSVRPPVNNILMSWTWMLQDSVDYLVGSDMKTCSFDLEHLDV